MPRGTPQEPRRRWLPRRSGAASRAEPREEPQEEETEEEEREANGGVEELDTASEEEGEEEDDVEDENDYMEEEASDAGEEGEAAAVEDAPAVDADDEGGRPAPGAGVITAQHGQEVDEDGFGVDVVRGNRRHAVQPAPYTDDEAALVRQVKEEAWRLCGKGQQIQLPEPITDGLVLPPTMFDSLLFIAAFLASFQPQLKLEGCKISIYQLDHVLGGSTFNYALAIRLHTALMRTIFDASPEIRAAAGPDLAASIERASPLQWQEDLAQFLLCLAAQPRCTESETWSHAVQQLRSVEYDHLAAAERVRILRQLCERAAELPAVRAAVERRAAWLDAQPWRWDVATALGRTQTAARRHALRVEPIGRDRRGRAYWCVDGALWVQWDGGAAPHRAAEVLRAAAAAREAPLHFTLARLLERGALAAPPPPPPPPPPPHHRPPLPPEARPAAPHAFAVPCAVTGARGRVHALDVLRAAEGALRAAAAAAAAASPPPPLEACRYALLWLEWLLPAGGFEAAWGEARAAWAARGRAARTARELGGLLVELEGGVRREVLAERWLRAAADGWAARLSPAKPRRAAERQVARGGRRAAAARRPARRETEKQRAAAEAAARARAEAARKERKERLEARARRMSGQAEWSPSPCDTEREGDGGDSPAPQAAAPEASSEAERQEEEGEAEEGEAEEGEAEEGEEEGAEEEEGEGAEGGGGGGGREEALVEAVDDAVCEACGTDADEAQLLICDGCNCAQHTYCARPQLEEVPEGDWHCTLCALKARFKPALDERQVDMAVVHQELSRVSHSTCELWRLKVPLAMTAGQLAYHLSELVAAFNRAKLRPLMEQSIEQQRRQAREERQRREEELRQLRIEQRDLKEVRDVLEGLIKTATRIERERALVQAREEREAAKRDARIDAEVKRCLDRLVTQVAREKRDRELYCVCRKPYNANLFYICCDECENWFHGKCVGLTDTEAELVDQYVCADCHAATGSLTTWVSPSAGSPLPACDSADGDLSESSARRESARKRARERAAPAAYPAVVLRLKYPKVTLRFKQPHEQPAADSAPGAYATRRRRSAPPSCPPSPPGSPGGGWPWADCPPSLPASPPGSPRAAGEGWGAATEQSAEARGEEAAAAAAAAAAEGGSSEGLACPPAAEACGAAALPPPWPPVGGAAQGGQSASAPLREGEGEGRTPCWAPAVGGAAELRFTEEGLVGCWYAVRLLEEVSSDQRAHVEISGLLAAGDDAAPLREWHPLQRLRPSPPATPPDFHQQLQPGSLAEVWYAEGWWLATVKEAVHADHAAAGDDSAASAGGAAEWVVETCEYCITHRAHASSLRPAWSWEEPQGSGWVVREKAAKSSHSAPVDKAGSDKGQDRRPHKRKMDMSREPARHSSREAPVARERVAKDAPREVKREAPLPKEPPKAPPVKEPRPLYVVGDEVEVQGTEEGFFGSWYAARVLEIKGPRRLRLCYLAFQEEDGSMWEDTIDEKVVRPLPPPHSPSGLDRCKIGTPLEVLLRGGWWEVVLLSIEGSKYVVGAERYKVQHRVSASHLRPAWTWDRDRRVWSSSLTAKSQKTAPRGAKTTKKDKSSIAPSQPVVGAIGCTKNAACLRGARHPGLCRFAPTPTSDRPDC